MTETAWVAIAVAGFGGFGLGLGLVIGAFIARTLRRYMRDEQMLGTRENEEER